MLAKVRTWANRREDFYELPHEADVVERASPLTTRGCALDALTQGGEPREAGTMVKAMDECIAFYIRGM